MMSPLEMLYYLGYKAKTALDTAKMQRLPVRVVSIGNITVGGTGKTPMTIALAKEARKRGFRPCVLTRGYGGKLKGPFVVSTEMYVEDVGDEPLHMAASLRDISVVKGVDRYEAGLFAIENLRHEPDLFILDDGFQHRRLYRDMDIVLISSRKPFHTQRLLPLGRLREPLSELSRADVFAFTKCETMSMPPSLYEDVRTFNNSAPIFLSRHKASFVMDSSRVRSPIESLQGKKVFAFSGIGEHAFFLETLREAGAEVVGDRKFRNHYRYRRDDLKRVLSEALNKKADWIITTEKDLMRLRRFSGLEIEDLRYLGIEVDVEKIFFDHVFSELGRLTANSEAY